MEGIRITERPANVSWLDISRLLKEAHAENARRGVMMPYPLLSPDELCEKTEGRGGKVFVALHEERLIGVGAVVRIEKVFWCCNGAFAYCLLGAVHPAYNGKGIYRQLMAARQKWAVDTGLSRMMLDTHEGNTRMRKICRKNGFLPVDYRIRDDHNSVVYVKWLNECPHSQWYYYKRYPRIKWKRKHRVQAESC